MTVGIDEVGRGCWAGPLLVVAAREAKELPHGLKDSKVVSKKQREKLYELLKEVCDFGEGWVVAGEIDRLGLSAAMRLGTERALAALNAKPGETIIFDGNINYCPPRYVHSSAIIDADALFPIVSAASIYAKVVRDTYMSSLPARYSVYEFSRHVGYGTKLHAELLHKHGVSDLHRRSFKPVKEIL